MHRKKASTGVDWVKAPDIKKKILRLVKTVGVDWVKTSKVYCYRSYNSKSRANARIWGLSKIWQLALKIGPAYVIEVLSEKFDKLSPKRQNEVLLHELAHIPKNFSGSLLPHVRKRGKRNFNDRVKRLINLAKNTDHSD